MENRFDGRWASYFQRGPGPHPEPTDRDFEGDLDMGNATDTLIKIKHSDESPTDPPHDGPTNNARPLPSIQFERTAGNMKIQYGGVMVRENPLPAKSQIKGKYKKIPLVAHTAADVEEGTWTANRPPPIPIPIPIDEFVRAPRDLASLQEFGAGELGEDKTTSEKDSVRIEKDGCVVVVYIDCKTRK